MGLFPLPSGGKFCRVNTLIKLSFDEADQFCKNSGLSGLAEAESNADLVRMAGISTCKFSFVINMVRQLLSF
jgi:hypothetical protein